MNEREKIVAEDLKRKGFKIEIGDYVKEPGIPDFKCFNFETNERMYVEVKNKNISFLSSQENKIKKLIRKGFKVLLAVVESKTIKYFELNNNLQKIFLEEVTLKSVGIKYYPQKCLKCGYEWEARKENPKACPNCKNRDWNKKVEKIK